MTGQRTLINKEYNAFAVAIEEARRIFDQHAAMRAEGGEAPTMTLLDLGGGMAGGFNDQGEFNSSSKAA